MEPSPSKNPYTLKLDIFLGRLEQDTLIGMAVYDSQGQEIERTMDDALIFTQLIDSWVEWDITANDIDDWDIYNAYLARSGRGPRRLTSRLAPPA